MSLPPLETNKPREPGEPRERRKPGNPTPARDSGRSVRLGRADLKSVSRFPGFPEGAPGSWHFIVAMLTDPAAARVLIAALLCLPAVVRLHRRRPTYPSAGYEYPRG